MAIKTAISMALLILVALPTVMTVPLNAWAIMTSEPAFYMEDQEGLARVELDVNNDEDRNNSFIVIVQFRDKEGVVRQIDISEPYGVGPSEELLAGLDYQARAGKWLVDVFVWTSLESPEPIASYKYIEREGSHLEVPMPSSAVLFTKSMLDQCEQDAETCTNSVKFLLSVHYENCLDYREFGIEHLNAICSDPRLEARAT